MPTTGAKPAPPTDAEKAIARARTLAKREDYFIAKVAKAFPPEDGSGLWEVLFLGRYEGNRKAGIRADARDARLPYCCWVRADGTGFVTEDWQVGWGEPHPVDAHKRCLAAVHDDLGQALGCADKTAAIEQIRRMIREHLAAAGVHERTAN